jgi:hemimethylated DNA binding protein
MIRSPRVEYVKFRIGQVIRHKIHGYRAVIIGWDETARAPNRWLKEHSVSVSKDR